MKKIIITAAACAIISAGILTIPEIIVNSIPTAKSISVEKITHADALELTGNIIKNASNGTIEVVAYVSEKDISLVKKGQTAEITGDAFPGCIYNGTVSFICEYAENIKSGGKSGVAVKIKIGIDNPDEKLKAGYTAKAKLYTSDAKTIAIVPYEAVNQDDIGEFVYVFENNSAKKRYITTGKELSNGIEISSGLIPGDKIITVDSRYSDGRTILMEE